MKNMDEKKYIVVEDGVKAKTFGVYHDAAKYLMTKFPGAALVEDEASPHLPEYACLYPKGCEGEVKAFIVTVRDPIDWFLFLTRNCEYSGFAALYRPTESKTPVNCKEDCPAREEGCANCRVLTTEYVEGFRLATVEMRRKLGGF